MTAELGASRSPGLDGLRAVACLAVVLFHLQSVAGVTFGPLAPFVAGGDTGVWLFFSLSGYLLYRPFLKRAVDLRSYGLKRAARILPAYYLALVALMLLTGSRLPFDHPLAYLTIASSYQVPLRDFLGPAWTLSAEVLFYVSLPLIARIPANGQVPVLVGLALASMAVSAVYQTTPRDATMWLNDAYPLVFYAFVPGMLLAVLEVRRPAWFAELAKPRYLVMGLLFLAVGMLTSALPIDVATLFGAPLTMAWVLHHRVRGARVLAFAGGASYALYLWNYDMIRMFGLAGVAIALVGAALSWSLVERPILYWAHRRAAAWRVSTRADPAAAMP